MTGRKRRCRVNITSCTGAYAYGCYISNHFQMGFIHNLCNREDMDVEDWAERATSRKKAEGGAGFSSKMRKFAEK